MSHDALGGMTQNAVLLLALAVLYDAIPQKSRLNRGRTAVLTGFLLGIIGIAVMASSWPFAPGVVFDTRSILLSLSGLFFGMIPTVIAAGITGLLRLYQGGAGVWVGLAVIVTSAGLGLGWRYTRERWRDAFSWSELYLFGIVVHIAMLLWMLLLPDAVRWNVLHVITFPVIAVYPIATIFLGLLLVRQRTRQETQQALQTSEAQYRRIVETAEEGIWLIDEHDATVFVNGKMTDILGYTVEEMTGANLFEFMDAAGRELSRGRPEQRRQGMHEQYDFQFRHKSGQPVWVHVAASPVFDGDGTFCGVLGMITDISKRKEMEGELQAKEEQYRELFVAHPVPMWVYDLDTLAFLDVNDAAVENYGYTREEFLARTIKDIRPDEDVPRLMEDVLQERPSLQHSGEWRHQFKDGRIIDVEITSHTLASMDHNAVLVMAQDITARKQAEIDLQKQKALLEQQVAKRTAQLQRSYHLKEALAQIGLALNQHYELQALLNEIVARVTELLPSSGGASVILWNKEQNEFTISAYTLPGQIPQTTSRRVRRRGATHWIMEHSEPLIVADVRDDPFYPNPLLTELDLLAYAGFPLLVGDEVLGVLYALSKEPREYPEEDQDFIAAMATRAATAITKLRLYEELETVNRTLLAQTERLQTVNRELETFTYSVSHDLKAPLRGIDGYSRLLLEDYADKLDEDGRSFLHTICRATQQMNELIEDLLAYSRLERHPVQTGEINLQELLRFLLDELADEMQKRGVQLQMEVTCTAVSADLAGLSMALRNLLDNALKFTRETAQPFIEIGCDKKTESCILWVHDNGIGFDMKYHDRIFEVFQRLHRAEEYPGTGIGLALVRKAMERMNGRAWAESTPGQGATFYLEIPREP